ncbi:hypothetical protein ACICHK_13560 [Streptomyces sp. AHU1]
MNTPAEQPPALFVRVHDAGRSQMIEKRIRGLIDEIAPAGRG